jgi:hypothetical protein
VTAATAADDMLGFPEPSLQPQYSNWRTHLHTQLGYHTASVTTDSAAKMLFPVQ